MELISDFLSLFTENNINTNNLDPMEDLYTAKLDYRIDKYTNPDLNSFLKTSTLICDILKTNTFEFSFKVINKDNSNVDVHPDLVGILFSSYSKNIEKIQEFYEKILSCEFNNIEDNELIILEIVIKKPMELENINRIYFFDKFMESIHSLDLKGIVTSPIINNTTESIIFLIDNEIQPFYTNDIYFIHDINELNDLNSLNIGYDSIYMQHKLNCHFINSSLNLTPYTFKLLKRSDYDNINIFFDKLEMIVSLIYIANYSEIVNSNSIDFHINGYKLINENLNFTDTLTVSKYFYDIFEWVYSENKISEKLELARNIISIDFKNSLYDINEKTLASIKSNYNIYLKENVDKYIELKNQITNNILDLSIKSREIISDFSSNFKNAFMANLSFVFSILILNLIGDNIELDNIFNKDLSIIYLIIVAGSLFYLTLSITTTYLDLKHYDSTFNNLRSMYIGILSDEDLDDTFNNSILKSDKKYIKKRVVAYSVAWFIILAISVLGLYYLSNWFEVEVINNIQNFKNSIKVFNLQ